MSHWLGLTRWRDWAHSKLPFAGAAALLLGLSPLHSLLVLVTVGLCAVFGYGVNEIADAETDSQGGKDNRALALPHARRIAFLAGTAAAALASSLAWAGGPATAILLAAGLVLAGAYSVRPVRLKERGLAGVAAAAAAQWTFPVLAIAAAGPHGLFHARGILVAVLSLTLGIRWMLVHQLHDADADRGAGVRTFATNSDRAPRLLGVVFAVELIVLAALLAAAWPDSRVAVATLVAWISLAELTVPVRARLSGYDAAPLAAYYFVLLPLSLGIARDTAGGLVAGTLFALLGLPSLVGALRPLLARGRPAAARP